MFLVGREKFGTWGNAALPTQPGDLAKTRSTGGLEEFVEQSLYGEAQEEARMRKQNRSEALVSCCEERRNTLCAALGVPGRGMDEFVLWVAGQGRMQELIDEAGGMMMMV